MSYGPPISLDWEYEQLPELDLDLYESNRGKRRGMRQMMMNYYQRKNLLTWRYGITEEELKKAEKEANKVKRGRSLTKAFLPLQKVEDMVQSVGRKTKRMTKGTPSASASSVNTASTTATTTATTTTATTTTTSRFPEEVSA